MAKKKRVQDKYILALFVVASALVFAVLFTIVLTPTIVTKFGFEPIFILLLTVSGVTASVLAILFYLLLRKQLRL